MYIQFSHASLSRFVFPNIFCLCSMQLGSVWCRPFSSPLMTISRTQLCAPRRLNAWMGRWSWGPSVALSATWTAPIPSSLSSSDAFNSTNSTTRLQTSLWTSSMRWSLGNYTSRYDRLLKFKRSTQHLEEFLRGHMISTGKKCLFFMLLLRAFLLLQTYREISELCLDWEETICWKALCFRFERLIPIECSMDAAVILLLCLTLCLWDLFNFYLKCFIRNICLVWLL